MIRREGYQKRIDLLSQHPLFKRLYGNPTALIQAATCYKHGLKINQENQKVGKLFDIYKMMKRTLIKYNDLDELGTEEQKCNDFSMEVATRMTLQLIPTKNRQTSARDLLFFLGCLPGGISMQHLQKMWH